MLRVAQRMRTHPAPRLLTTHRLRLSRETIVSCLPSTFALGRLRPTTCDILPTRTRRFGIDYIDIPYILSFPAARRVLAAGERRPGNENQ